MTHDIVIIQHTDAHTHGITKRRCQRDKRSMRLQHFHQMAQEVSDIYTDTRTHVIKKKLAEGQLSKTTREA